MNPVPVLFVLSADFGEYVTASLFARNQPFAVRLAVPASLAPYLNASTTDLATYASAADIKTLVISHESAVVCLCSAYLYALNRLFGPDELADLLDFLRERGIAVATTDPWLRIWSLRPGARLRIYSVRQGGEDVAQSRTVARLQAKLELLLAPVPHLFAVPLEAADRRCLPFYNPHFSAKRTPAGERGSDEWLFVLSREDFVYLAGFEREGFFASLGQRIETLLGESRNRLTFVGPAPLGEYLTARWAAHPRVSFVAFCDVVRFEAMLTAASIVVYWNVLSSSLLYCLYHRVPPIFFGTGHQVKLCDGLFEHASRYVYRDRPPRVLEPAAPLTPHADELIAQLDIRRWLDHIADDYARLPGPAAVINRLLVEHGRS